MRASSALIARLASQRSKARCAFIQNSGELPNKRDSRIAISGLIARVHAEGRISTKRLSDSRSSLCWLQLCKSYSASAESHSIARWSLPPRLSTGDDSSVHHNSPAISASYRESIPAVTESGEFRSPEPITVTAGTFLFRLRGVTIIGQR